MLYVQDVSRCLIKFYKNCILKIE